MTALALPRSRPAVLLDVATGCAVAAALPRGGLRRAGRAGRVLLLVAALGLTVSAVLVVGTAMHDVESLLGNAGLAGWA
jgi:hypothetical protein